MVKMLCVKLGDSFVSLYMYVLILLSVVITFDYHIYGLCCFDCVPNLFSFWDYAFEWLFYSLRVMYPNMHHLLGLCAFNR